MSPRFPPFLVGIACGLTVLGFLPSNAAASPAWSPSSTLSVGQYPDVAVSAGGDGLAVWTATGRRFQTTGIAAAARAPGSGWSQPEFIATGEHVSGASVAVDGGGNAVVIWVESQRVVTDFQPRGCLCRYLLRARSRSSAGRLGPVETLADSAVPGSTAPPTLSSGAENPILRMNVKGDAVVVWSNPGIGRVVASYRSADGGPFGPAETVVERDHLLDFGAALGRDGDVAVGIEYYTTAYGPSAETLREVGTRPAGQSFGSFERVPGGAKEVPRLGFDRAGSLVAVFAASSVDSQGTEGARTLQAAVRPRGEPFREPVRISPDGTAITGAPPALGEDGAGNLVAAWFEGSQGSPRRLWTAGRASGQVFEPAKPLAELTGDELQPAVALAPSGAAAVSWLRREMRDDGSYPAIPKYRAYGVVSPGDDRFSEPAGLSPIGVGQGPHQPVPAVDSAGRALVVWHYLNYEHACVQAATYGDEKEPENVAPCLQPSAPGRAATDAALVTLSRASATRSGSPAIRFSATCNEACAVRAEGRIVSAEGAAQLHAVDRPLTAERSTHLRLRLSPSAERILARAQAPRAVLKVIALNAAGKRRTVTRSFKLRR